MKSTHKTQRFNYSTVTDSDLYEYYGIHPKHGRLHIDTKRLKKVLTSLNKDDLLFEGMFKNRLTTYLIPKKIHRYYYKINIIRDYLDNLKEERIKEYRPLLNKIKTPLEVKEESRVNTLLENSNSEIYDEIEADALFNGMLRESQYNKIIKSLYYLFINKIAAEIERIILIFLKYQGKYLEYYDFKKFLDHTESLMKQANTDKKVEDLNKYNSFNVLLKINNFLKHNSKSTYDRLKEVAPNLVRSIDNKTSCIKYESGMFSGNWLLINDDYIDNVFNDLLEFFGDYCFIYLNEDFEESKWNYDEYFKDLFKKLKNTY